MAVLKTTQTRYVAGSVQATQGVGRLHKQPHPYILNFFIFVLEGFCMYTHYGRACRRHPYIHVESLPTGRKGCKWCSKQPISIEL